MKHRLAFYLAILFAVLSTLFLFVFNYPFALHNQLFFLPVQFWISIFGSNAICGPFAVFACFFGGWLGVTLMNLWALFATISSGFFLLSLNQFIHSRHQIMIGQNNAIQRQPRTEKAKQMLPSFVLSLVTGACYLACLVFLFPQIDDAYGILGLEFLTALLYCVLSMELLKTSIQDTELGLARNIAFGVFAGLCFAIATYAYYYIEDLISTSPPFILPFFYGYAARHLPILTGASFVIACVFAFDHARRERSHKVQTIDVPTAKTI
jgi:hypothetical protein